MQVELEQYSIYMPPHWSGHWEGRPRALCTISTRRSPGTDRHGPRVSVFSSSGAGGRLSVPWDDNLNEPENHWAAGMRLARKLGWSEGCTVELGATKHGYVLVFVPNIKEKVKKCRG